MTQFRDRRLPLIYAIILLDVIVGSAIGPIMPAFVKGLDKPQVWLSVGTALFLGVQLFSAPLLGKLADGYGRRPIFIISAIGTLVADILLLPVRVGFYFANRLSDGVSNGMYAAVRSAITDISPKEQLFKNLGVEGVIVSLGFVLGPLVSGILLTVFDVPAAQQAGVVVAMTLVISGANILLTFLLGETHPNPPGVSRVELRAELRNSLNISTIWARLQAKDVTVPGLLKLVMMQVCLTLGLGYYHYFVAFISLGELQMTARDISYFFIFFGALSIVVNYGFYGFVADRINQRRWIFWLALAGIPILAGYGLSGSSLTVLYAVIIVDCLTISLIQGLIEGLMAQLTTDDDRGEVFGLNQAMQGLASFSTTIVFGALSVVDLRLPFLWFAACMGAVAWLAKSSR